MHWQIRTSSEIVLTGALKEVALGLRLHDRVSACDRVRVDSDAPAAASGIMLNAVRTMPGVEKALCAG
jgi:hypothetical protein